MAPSVLVMNGPLPPEPEPDDEPPEPDDEPADPDDEPADPDDEPPEPDVPAHDGAAAATTIGEPHVSQ